MTSDKRLADAIRVRLAEIDKERDHLVALLDYYGAAPPPKVVASISRSTAGPTERILAVVAEHPGMKYSEVLDHAQVGMDTDADNPRRSLGSTLGSLVKRGKVRKEDGMYYPMTEA